MTKPLTDRELLDTVEIAVNDKLRDHFPGKDLRAGAALVDGSIFVHYCTQINCKVQYLLVLKLKEASSVCLLVSGNDLYQASREQNAGDLHVGVNAYLAANGHYEDTGMLDVEVYKLTGEPILTLVFQA